MNEILQLLTREYDVHRLISILNILKDQPQTQNKINNVANMNKFDKFYLDPQVDLEIEGFLIPQFVVYFSSQVNIFPKITWINLVDLSLPSPNFT